MLLAQHVRETYAVPVAEPPPFLSNVQQPRMMMGVHWSLRNQLGCFCRFTWKLLHMNFYGDGHLLPHQHFEDFGDVGSAVCA